MTVVSIQIMEEVLLATLHTGTAAGNMSFLRIVRILRLVRILRAWRIVQFFAGLRRLVVSILNTMHALFWTLILMLFGIYGTGIYFTQLVGEYRSYYEDDDEVVQRFGGLSSSMFSLFQ